MAKSSAARSTPVCPPETIFIRLRFVVFPAASCNRNCCTLIHATVSGPSKVVRLMTSDLAWGTELLRCVAIHDAFGGKPLIFKRDAEVGVGHAWEQRGRAGFGFAGMAEHGGFHRVPLVVPHVSATTGTVEFNAPELLVQFHRVLVRIEAFPFVKDGQVVPGEHLEMGL